MKQLLLLSIFLVIGYSFAQTKETFRIEKQIKEPDYYPRINGVFTGEISIISLGSFEGITTNVGWEITSYKITYPVGRDDKSVIIRSNRIPDSVLVDLRRYAIQSQIFITEIMAKDQTNTNHLLKSMMLIPIIEKEDEK